MTGQLLQSLVKYNVINKILLKFIVEHIINS